MQITLNGKTITLNEGARYVDAVKTMYPDTEKSVLGIRIGGRTVSLEEKVDDDVCAHTLALSDEEGRRMYERSLRFILLLAMRELHPAARVRVENSTQLGVRLTVDGVTMNVESVRHIENKMRELIAKDLPYEKMVISRKEAMALFKKQGEMDKVRLLAYRPHEHFQVYQCVGMPEYFYGEMVPSTGYTSVFALRFQLPDIELQLPDLHNEAKPGSMVDSPMLRHTFAESTVWGKILGCENTADLNEMVENKKIREFIRINEALHEKSISEIADAFVKSGAQLVLIAGPSSSGKTTFANRLSIQLRVRGLRPMKVSMDDYYIDREKIPLEADGKPDLERLDTLDVERFNEDLVELLQGKAVNAPLFDFKAGKRSEKTHRMHPEAGQPIIVEGIHALNDELTHQVPRDKKFLIYISALTTLNLDDHNRIRTTDARLLRRMVRDHLFRGTPPEETMDMWDSVRRGEHNYIFPFQECADVMFNSTLLYEMVVLKKYAYPMLMKVKPENEQYTRAYRLVKFLNYIQSTDVEDEIPQTSILREFIGGCTFYRNE